MEMCSESGYGVVDSVGGCMEYLRDGIRPELELEKVVEKGVPLQNHHLNRIFPCLATGESGLIEALVTSYQQDTGIRKLETYNIDI